MVGKRLLEHCVTELVTNIDLQVPKKMSRREKVSVEVETRSMRSVRAFQKFSFFL
jgi:hypothetical protein